MHFLVIVGVRFNRTKDFNVLIFLVLFFVNRTLIPCCHLHYQDAPKYLLIHINYLS
jgi:hypothetical protein